MESDEKFQGAGGPEDLSASNESGGEAGAGGTEELAAIRARAEKAEQDLLYMRADFDNTRRRLIREQEQAIRFSNEKLIGEIFRVVDLFDRAIASGAALKQGSKEVASFVTGVEMTQKELVSVLEKFGVEILGKTGETFNPQQHEAVSQMKVESKQADTVLEVLQRGCALHGRTLVPAKVVVGIT
jgi:molecular chaperone GrpE